jgi:hypothetical protein
MRVPLEPRDQRLVGQEVRRLLSKALGIRLIAASCPDAYCGSLITTLHNDRPSLVTWRLTQTHLKINTILSCGNYGAFRHPHLQFERIVSLLPYGYRRVRLGRLVDKNSQLLCG